MSATAKHLYKFGEFSFDTAQNILMRGDKPLALTPKMLELLRVLVENHGRILKKDDLMETVWADSFVEEGNLKFTINQLRKALGDDAHHPLYIETIARRGYRFIAPVVRVEAVPELNGSTDLRVGKAALSKSRNIFAPVIAVTILLVSLFAAVFWFAQNKTGESSAPVLFAPFASEKLTTTGKVTSAVISPDGKNAVYTNVIGEKTSVWLRQLESANNVEVIAPSDDRYFGLALSSDGNFIYFSRRPRGVDGQANIYRVSIFGGVPTEVVREAQGWMSLSPDGTRISFVRCPYLEEENCSLWIADSTDGKNERKLAARPQPLRIGDNRISPDGKSVAFAVGQSENQANEFSLVEVNLESGAERPVSQEKFFNIKSLAWLADKSGLLITASKIPNKNYRIWQISAATGEAAPLTMDSETYADLSLDKSGRRIISTQVKEDYHLLLASLENQASSAQSLVNARTVEFAPNGKILFSSTMTGNEEIWSINADGSGQKQLTNAASDESAPVASPDNKTIYFASNRAGAVQVWRMNADGSNQAQITQKDGGFPLIVSPDGKWLYFIHGLTRTLWRVSVASGEAQLMLEKRKDFFALSPDAAHVVFLEKPDGKTVLNIVSLAGGETIKVYALPEENARVSALKWSPDGKNLVYSLANSEFKNNALWLQPLDGKPPQRIVELGSAEINSLALAPDGKTFAFVQGEWRHDAVFLKGLR